MPYPLFKTNSQRWIHHSSGDQIIIIKFLVPQGILSYDSLDWVINTNTTNFLMILLPSAPMDTNLTPLEAMKSSALLTFAILWNLILPRSGLGNWSPEITSNNNISFSPLRKSSSMFSMPVPAFRKCELHQAVKVCNTDTQATTIIMWCFKQGLWSLPTKT